MNVEVTTEDGYVPVPAVLSQEVDNVVTFHADSDDGEWKAHAFTIDQISRRTERINNLPTLSPGESLDFGFMGESTHSQVSADPGRDRLRVADDRDRTLVEYGIAVNPAGVLVGLQNPTDEEVTGVQDADRLRGYGPQNSQSNDFTDFGSVRSEWTRTETGVPTTALSPTNRQGVVRFDKAEDERNNISLGFYNTREDEAALEVLAHGATYKVTHINEPSVVRDMAFGNGYKRRVLTYGGLSNTNPKRPREWIEGEVTLSQADAVSALRGGGRA